MSKRMLYLVGRSKPERLVISWISGAYHLFWSQLVKDTEISTEAASMVLTMGSSKPKAPSKYYVLWGWGTAAVSCVLICAPRDLLTGDKFLWCPECWETRIWIGYKILESLATLKLLTAGTVGLSRSKQLFTLVTPSIDPSTLGWAISIEAAIHSYR